MLGEPTGFHLTPVPVGENLSSLSAILMDEEFYSFTLENSVVEDGLHIATPLSLVCLKAKAYLNLSKEKLSDTTVRSFDIKKHRDDVFKLLAMRIDPLTPIELSDTMKSCIAEFISSIETTLLNQSSQDSLRSTNDQIRGYLTFMKEIFTIDK